MNYIDAFTDLDPLGTGKNRPYVDKKYFFQDLKYPPKKVLKDLSGKNDTFAANFSSSPSILNSNELDEKNDNLCEIDLKLFESPSNINERNIEKFIHIHPSNDTSTATTSFNKNDSTPILSDFPSDPFLNSKNDPFMEDDFSKATIDPFEFSYSPKHNPAILTDIQILSETETQKTKSLEEKPIVFNGPLQVNLPPESWNAQIGIKKLEKQLSESNSPTIPTAISARNRPSVFKQNTVDVISSISSKKMKPHIFTQKFSKRDSNSINMRRLQESDSLSENETAPEPPPRPESVSHIEPPPLPPKKQFSDIVIRPSSRSTSSSTSNMRESPRYDFLSSKIMKSQQNDNAPPLPLPSRKVGRNDSSYPGPGRPAKKNSDDEDYLTPISKNEPPILLPPPQQKIGSKTRQNRKIESSDSIKSEPENKLQLSESPIPESVLTELAKKLNVPASKLSEMSAVEFIAVTAQISTLSDIIEISKKNIDRHSTMDQPKKELNSAVFKVSFDQGPEDATFVAKFDDSFGEDTEFVANFDSFNQTLEDEPPKTQSSTDRYAVFREIIEQEINQSSLEVETFETPIGSLTMTEDDIRQMKENDRQIDHRISPITAPVTKIDTKITEVISLAKDRYAALRDIVLVEDLFDKTLQHPKSPAANFLDDTLITSDEDLRQSNDNSPEINIHPDSDSACIQIIESEAMNVTNILTNTKDDLEIDEYMNRAISNLSLDSRDHLTPISNKTPMPQLQNASTSPISLRNKSPLPLANTIDFLQKTTLNDMSTSPIPITKSPSQISPTSKSPLPQNNATNILNDKRNINDEQNNRIAASSPEDSNVGE